MILKDRKFLLEEKAVQLVQFEKLKLLTKLPKFSLGL